MVQNEGEKMIRTFLDKHTKLKKLAITLYSTASRLKHGFPTCTNNVLRIVPKDSYEYFFGYYDKSPWNISESKMLGLRVKSTLKSTASSESAEIVLIDVRSKEIQVIAKTNAWNVQQGCMLQWMGPTYDRYIIYNDYRENKLCAVVLDLDAKSERKICEPIYSIDAQGRYAYTLDFYRLQRLRPGYGYCNEEDKYKNVDLPSDFCIKRIDVKKNESKGIISYKMLYDLDKKESMIGAQHKINHIMISPNGKRIMFIHRWKNENGGYSRLIASNIDGSNMVIVSDEMFVSHCIWVDNRKILGYVQKGGKRGYYIMDSFTGEYTHIWKELSMDGHPSVYSLSGVSITDTYPNRNRMASIFMIDKKGKITKVVECFSPTKYFAEYRCDLHPRFSRDGKKICFDSTHEGKRAMYIVNLPPVEE